MSGVLKKAYETLECNYTCGLSLRKFLRVLALIGMTSSIVYIAVGSYIIVHIVQTEKVEWFPNAYYRLPEGPTASRIVVPPPAHFQHPGSNVEDFGVYRPPIQRHYQPPFQEKRPNLPMSQHSIFPMADETKRDEDLRLEEQDRAIYYRRNVGLFICLAATLILINFIQLITDISLFRSTFRTKGSSSFWVFFLLNIILWIMTLICFTTIFSGGGIFLLFVFLTGTAIRAYMVYILHELMADIRRPRSYSGATVAEPVIRPEPRTIVEAEEGCAEETEAENTVENVENVESTPDVVEDEEPAAASTKSLQPSQGSQDENEGGNETDLDIIEKEHLLCNSEAFPDAEPVEDDDAPADELQIGQEDAESGLEDQIILDEELEVKENEEGDDDTVEIMAEEDPPELIEEEPVDSAETVEETENAVENENEDQVEELEKGDDDRDNENSELVEGADAEPEQGDNDNESVKNNLEDEILSEGEALGESENVRDEETVNEVENEEPGQDETLRSEEPGGESTEQLSADEDLGDAIDIGELETPEEEKSQVENTPDLIEQDPEPDLADDASILEEEGKVDIAVQANPEENSSETEGSNDTEDMVNADDDPEENANVTENMESDDKDDKAENVVELEHVENSETQDGDEKVPNEQEQFNQETPADGEQTTENVNGKSLKNSRKRRKNSRRKRKVKLAEEVSIEE